MAIKDWRQSTWGDEVVLEYGKALRNYDTDVGQYRVYGSNGPIGWTSEYLFDAPGVILGRKGAYRGVEYSEKPFFVIDTAYSIKPLSPMNMRWLYYAVKHHKLGEIDDGSPIPSTTRAAVYVKELEIPPTQVQERIADILGTLDDKIELNRRTNETLESMARALFKSWFVEFDPVREKAAGRKHAGLDADTAQLFPSAFEDAPLGKVPLGWRAMPLPVAIEVNPTRSMSKGTVAPYLEMGNMPTASARAIAWENREFGSGMRFINGDTLVAKITPCLENGKTAYVDFLGDGEVGWGSTEYIVLRSKPPLPTTFSYFLARTEAFRSHVIKNMTGTSGRQRAPAECLDKYMMVVPDAKVADRFGEFADGCLALMKQNDEESATLAAARDALLPKLLSGEVSVLANGELASRQ